MTTRTAYLLARLHELGRERLAARLRALRLADEWEAWEMEAGG